MSELTIRNGQNSFATSQNHRFQLGNSTSCTTQSQRVSLLQRDIDSLEQRANEMLDSLDDQDFYNGAILVSGILKDTCLGILNMAAEILPESPAKKTAKIGIAAIETSGTATELYLGQISKSEAAIKLTKTASDFAGMPDGLAGASLSHVKNTTFGMAGVAAAGVTRGQDAAKSEGMNFVVDTTVSQFTLIGQAIEQGAKGDSKIAGPIGSGVKTAIDVYKRWQEFSAEQVRIASSRQSWKASFDKQLSTLKTSLNQALSSLIACQSGEMELNEMYSTVA